MSSTGHKPTKVIGILGGMGPVTSANLYQLINQTAQRDYHAEQDIDFPEMFIYNMPLKGFDETGFVDEKAVQQQLVKGVKKLESIGSDFIIIPCNTVHYFIDEMRSAVTIPIISIIESTVNMVEFMGFKTVGLCSSQSTRNLHLYEKAFEQKNINVISTAESEQQQINRVILHVMSGIQGDDDKIRLKLIIDRMLLQGAEAIVLGCTELPLAFEQKDIPDTSLFSSTHILAEEALRQAMARMVA